MEQLEEATIKPKGQHRRQPSIATMEHWLYDGVAIELGYI